MTCCIVGLLVLAVVGRIRRVFGVAEEPALFAPVATRPAPGQILPQPVRVDADPRPAGAAVFRYAAAGVAICLVGTPMLVWLGVLENTGSTAMWLLRALCYLALIGLAVVLSRSVALLRGIRGAGWLLVVLGAVIFESGVADMHLFGLIEVDHHANMFGDMVFHNVGPLIAVIGGLVLLYGAAGRRSTSSRSSRSTVTSARPSSSAVTVSSTPPVTT